MQTQAEKIQNLIRKRGVLQKEFAESIGYQRESSFSRAINSEHIGDRTLQRIAAGLGMTKEKLLSILRHEPPDAEEVDLLAKVHRLENEVERLQEELNRSNRVIDAITKR